MTITELKEMKRELGLTNEMIAGASGIPLGTVQKVFAGTTKAPRLATRLALENAILKARGDRAPLPGTPPQNSVYSQSMADQRDLTVCESPASYGASAAAADMEDPKQGRYTLEDYYALPEERRVELIDGVIYDMASPTGYHQLIAGELYAAFLSYIRSKKGSCMPFISPIDVRLDCDDKTMVQPDVLILCDKSKYTPRRIEGAPDFIAEVLSPSSKTRDLFIKLNKYRAAGVREYWVIDPKKKVVSTYHFEDNDEYSYYSFRDRVPVGIYGGDLVIDFAPIDDVISDWM
ncbi:MAG: Uma2 family endonuclease [Lachnospiraceae bacterium]|nr:Uma2 family endonuclease [Lachnospiraceae bacterium]